MVAHPMIRDMSLAFSVTGHQAATFLRIRDDSAYPSGCGIDADARHGCYGGIIKWHADDID